MIVSFFVYSTIQFSLFWLLSQYAQKGNNHL